MSEDTEELSEGPGDKNNRQSSTVPPILDVSATDSAHARDNARRELLELSITAAGIGTFDWDLIEGTLAWDDRLIELFGYEPKNFDQSIEHFNARLHPDDLDRVSAEIQSAIEGCGELISEYRVVLPGGQVRWVGARGRVLCDEQGVASRMLGAAWDITSRAEEEAKISRALESISTPFFALDTSWRFTYANGKAERILGFAREELVGSVIWDLFPASIGSDFEAQYRYAMTTGHPVAFDAYYPAPLDAWFEVRASRNMDGLAVYFVEVTARHKAQQQAERAAERARLLSRITEHLAGTLESEEASRRLLRLVIPALADWGIVTLIGDDHEPGSRPGLLYASAYHSDANMQETIETYANARLEALSDDALIVKAMGSSEPQLILSDAKRITLPMFEPGRIRDLLDKLDPESVAIYPLEGRNGPVGMITLTNGPARGSFTAEDLVTIDHVTARAGLVLDNARLYRQQRELAEGLQRQLLTAPVEPDHLQVVVRYSPAAKAAQVGGDWYDAFVQRGGATMVVIGDVIGHHAEATSMMGQLRSIVRTIGALDDESPVEVLRNTDRVMETLCFNTTATAVVARLEQNDSELSRGITRFRWSNAGHPPPMVINPNGSVLVLREISADLLLGVAPSTDRRESQISLDRYAVVLLYTDGLVERRGQSLDDGLLLLQKCLEELADLDLESLCDEVLARMLPPDTEDDVAIVAVKLHPQNKPRPAEAGPRRVPPHVIDPPEVVPQPD